MAKVTLTTGTDGQSLHGRTTADTVESQAVVIGTDGSDVVLDPSTLATQATLASILAAVDGLEGFTDGLETLVTATNAKDFATQTTLAAILAKLIAAPATEASLAILSTPLTMGTPVRVSDSATVQTLAAANASRRALYLFNESTAALRVKFAAAASATSYTVLIPANGFIAFEPPVSQAIVTGIWDADTASGAVMVTEAT